MSKSNVGALQFEATPSKFLKRKAMIKQTHDMRRLSTKSVMWKLYRERHFDAINTGLLALVVGLAIGLSL